MLKEFFLAILFLLSIQFSQAQQFPFHKEIKFIKYLQNNHQINDAEYALNNISTKHLTAAQLDSLNFEKGFFYYSIKKLDTSIKAFLAISKNDTRYIQSNFFAAYELSFLQKKDSAKYILDNLEVKDSAEAELKAFQLAGIALLQNNKEVFSKEQSLFTYNNYFLKQEEENFTSYSKSIFSHKRKSKFVAGALSAIIPGAGKWYAGKKKQAIGAFLPIISSALLTLEAYNKGGIKDARFWIYGSLFTTFYIGNIWGSTIAVKVRNDEFNKVYENKILFDMHIPLRNFYN
jgi:hypothetical protein